MSASITPHIQYPLSYLLHMALCQLSTHYHRLWEDSSSMNVYLLYSSLQRVKSSSVLSYSPDLYVVKKCYLMLPGPLFFQPVFSIIWSYKQTQGQGWSHCVCRANDRGEKQKKTNSPAQDCGLNTMSPHYKGSGDQSDWSLFIQGTVKLEGSPGVWAAPSLWLRSVTFIRATSVNCKQTGHWPSRRGWWLLKGKNVFT